MNKLDKQIYEILNDFINHNLEVTYGEATSKIKQSILKAIMEEKPKESHINYHIEDGIEYRDQNDIPVSISWEKGYNRALEEFESVIKEVLK